MNTKIIQITAGRGPAECCWVVAKVLKYFLKEIAQHQIDYTILHQEAGMQNGTVQSVTMQLTGKELPSFLSGWLGTIKWIGTSTFRKHYKRKNWFIGCFEIKDTQTITLDERDIHFQATRSSGPGGQHVNKVSSAIRATHKKTGLQVQVMDSRSQHQNRKIAIQRLQEKIATHNIQQLQQNIEAQWKNHLDLQRGNPVRIFKGSDFKKQPVKKTFKAIRKQEKDNFKKQLKKDSHNDGL